MREEIKETKDVQDKVFSFNEYFDKREWKKKTRGRLDWL